VGSAPAGAGAKGILMNSGARTQATMAMTVSGLVIGHQVAGKASRVAIFLSQFPTTALPPMVTVAAIVAVAASIGGSRMLVRSGSRRVLPLSLALSGALQLAEWLLLGYNARLAACVIYLHMVAFGPVLISAFWSLMNESFAPRSAKGLFGKIGGMGTLGGLCGGLLAERVAAWFGARDVVLLLAALHLICAGLTARLARFHGSSSHEQARETSAVDAVQRYPFLLTLAGLVILASSGAALLDFVFKARAAQIMGRGAPLLRFFSVYYTGASLLTFLAQTFLARVCVKHAGLAVTAGTLPVSISLGSLAGLWLPGFPALCGIRASEILVRGSLYRTAYELFYAAISPADKRAVKSVIDVGADRAGDAIGAAGVSLMLALAPGRYGPILALSCGVSAAAVILAARLRPGYLHALEKSLVDRAVEIDPSLVEDSATRSVLMQSVAMGLPASAEEPLSAQNRGRAAAPGGNDPFLRRAADLRSGDAARAMKAAAEAGRDDWCLAPLIIDLLAWDEAMPAARDALIRMGPNITGMLVDALLDAGRDFVIRRRIPRVLAHLPSYRCVDGLFAALEDPRFEVRFYAGRALYLLLKQDPVLSPAPERVWAALNRELSVQRPRWDSHRLLDSRAAQEKDWYFDDELLDRADRNLEHLFTLLALLLPVDAVRIAFRALHTEDAQLKATAFEYLDTATPAETRDRLLPLLEADAENRSRAASANGALEKLLASTGLVNRKLNLQPVDMEARK
jgi:AAA family ATP:ADP antiporter